MIKQIENLPENIIGFIYSGKVTGKDYETMLFPAIKKITKGKKKIRMLVEFGKNFKGLNLKAMMDDSLIGFKYFHDWERIAIISDLETLNHIIKAFGFMVPGDIKIFHLSEKAEAIEWISKTNEKK